jgi:transposase-like protein
MFQPPFCPNKYCREHRRENPGRGWFSRNGFYPTTKGTRVQRFVCKKCGTRFSTQTFSIDIYTKRQVSYHYIFNQLKSGAGLRSISRDLKASTNLVTNRCSRLARQFIAMHASIRNSMTLQESLGADGFESFVRSQYYPNNINLLAGKDSQFIYLFNYAYMKRKGRMSPRQKKLQEYLDTVISLDTKSIRNTFSEAVMTAVELIKRSGMEHAEFYTDKKKEYLPALEENKELIEHHSISSKEPRTFTNILFSLNYLDREIRKDNANHVRETVQFARTVTNCMERLHIYAGYHNYVKPYRIAKGKELAGICHGEAAGIKRETISREMRTIFTRRRFLSRVDLAVCEVLVWFRRLFTPPRIFDWKIPKYLYG